MIALSGMTIERKVKSSRRNAAVRTKAKTIGTCALLVSLKSFDSAVKPVTSAVTPGTAPIVAGIMRVPQLVHGRIGLGVGAVARDRDVHLDHAAVGKGVERDRGLEQRAGLRPRRQCRDALPDLRCGALVGADHDHGRNAPPREGVLNPVVGLDRGDVLGQRLDAFVGRVEAERRQGQEDQQARG